MLYKRKVFRKKLAIEISHEILVKFSKINKNVSNYLVSTNKFKFLSKYATSTKCNLKLYSTLRH